MELNYTYFYIKLFKNPDSDGKTREFISTINLNYPIRRAKFLKISNIFIKDTFLLAKCNLVDEDFLYTNIREEILKKERDKLDIKDSDKSKIFNSQIIFLGYGGEESKDIIKIKESKSLINDFTISVKNLNNTPFDVIDIENASIKIKIYHES